MIWTGRSILTIICLTALEFFLEYIKSIGGRYIFLTNNSSKSVNKYIEKLAGLGISSTADDFLTSTNATILFLHTVSGDFIKTYFQQPSYIAFTVSGAL
ncbi:MAG: hypothetical protein E7616_09100 [Ruminococcaceae bacterium]|nr:hypothetical protein [Oscillospiraceae bacterium]